MKDFKISCHAISEIMAGNIGLTDVQSARLNELANRKMDAEKGVDKVKLLTPNMENELKDLVKKSDNPELPKGAKTYLKTWVKKTLFNRKEDWKAIVVEKGLQCEPEAIELLKRVLHLPYDLQKNDEYFDNDFMQGCPDLLPDDVVRDVKSSWDLFTFPMFDDKIPNDDYWWQLQGYMALTGREKASIDYVLIDTPMPLILLDLKKLYFQSGGKAEDWTPERYEALYPNYQFGDIPEKLRVRSFEVLRDPKAANEIKERVLLCREYLKTLVSDEIEGTVKQLQEIKTQQLQAQANG